MPVGAGRGIPGPQLSGMNEAFSDRNLIKMGAASSLPVAKVIGTSAQHLGRSCLAAFDESPSLRCAPAYPCAGSWRARRLRFIRPWLTSANILDSESEISPLSSPSDTSPGS